MSIADLARIPRKRPTLVLLATAGLMALLLSQCKMVDERLTGVSNPLKLTPQQCFDKCQKNADNSFRAEDARHTSKLADCAGDATCIALENARHDAALAQIRQDLQACQTTCHQQGGGFGGN